MEPKQNIPSIKVEERNVHGRILIYPRCEKSTAITQLTGFKTIRAQDIPIIRALGYEIEFVSPVKNLME